MSKIEVFTDGACLGNPGPGGWAALLRTRDRERIVTGGDPATTNNRMELMAAISALEALTRPCQVVLTTDSRYVMKGIEEWMPTWRANGWRTANRKPVKNQDLWKRLFELTQKHRIGWQWVRGHSDHKENEQVDQAARQQAEYYRTNCRDTT